MEYSEAEKQMLREVLPGIAVQLRGALANIHGALGRLAPERLRDRDTGTDRSAAILCQSYYKILRVVNNLSDAPMLAEDKPLDTENVELVELLEGLCRQGQVLAELLDLRLVFTCRDRAHVIAANRELLERLFWNLVSNAMKFTPPGGTIEVALRTGPDCVLLCVKDSGPGIPQDKLERLFDRWQHSNMDLPVHGWPGPAPVPPHCPGPRRQPGGLLPAGGGHRGNGAPAGPPQRRDPDAPAALPLCRRLQPGAGGAGRRPAGPGVHQELY